MTALFPAFVRKHRSLRWVDVLVVGYLGGTGLLLVPGCTVDWIYPLCIGLHGAAIGGILALARVRSLPLLARGLRDLYPLLLLLLLYGEVDLLVKVLHGPTGFDAIVREWDRWLFGTHLHHHFSEWLSGPGWREVFHFFYLSYYLLAIGAFVTVWQRRPEALPHFAFVVIGMFVSFLAIFVTVPVAGPLSTPGVSLMTAGFFPGIVAQIYTPATVDGIHTGAFPSSHVGMSVGIVLLLAPRRWWVRIGLGLLLLGIAASTVYGRFHYAIDTVAGLVAGGGLYAMWRWIWASVHGTSKKREEPVQITTESPRPLR